MRNDPPSQASEQNADETSAPNEKQAWSTPEVLELDFSTGTQGAGTDLFEDQTGAATQS